MAQRQVAADKTRWRILEAARKLLLSRDFSEFAIEEVARKADVSRLTIYYQFRSKTGLLEALYDHVARRGHMERLAEVFGKPGDRIEILREFITVFVQFWASDRALIRRLHGLGAIDSEIGKGLRARNERRRKGASVVVDRCSRMKVVSAAVNRATAIDTVHMLTSFETFDDLTHEGRSLEDVIDIIEDLSRAALGIPAFGDKQVPHHRGHGESRGTDT